MAANGSIGQAIGHDRVDAGALGDGETITIFNSSNRTIGVSVEPIPFFLCELGPNDHVVVEFIGGTTSGALVSFDERSVTIWDRDFVKTEDYSWERFDRTSKEAMENTAL